MHKTPSRDSRGRFAAVPTSDAPSWYVFSAEGYRIPGEPLPEVLVPSVAAPRAPLPRAVAQPRRSRVTQVDRLTWLVFAVGYIAMLWYGLQLPRPHR